MNVSSVYALNLYVFLLQLNLHKLTALIPFYVLVIRTLVWIGNTEESKVNCMNPQMNCWLRWLVQFTIDSFRATSDQVWVGSLRPSQTLNSMFWFFSHFPTIGFFSGKCTKRLWRMEIYDGFDHFDLNAIWSKSVVRHFLNLGSGEEISCLMSHAGLWTDKKRLKQRRSKLE